jgi:hypothetical protein
MLSDGIVQQITHRSLAEIRRFLKKSGAGSAEPFSGLPRVGEIDFTSSGAELYLKLFKAVFSKGENAPRTSHIIAEDASHRIIYGSDKSFTCEGVYDFVCQNEEYRLIACEPVEFCGAWFDRWWLRHPDGWMIIMTVEKIE